MTQRIHEKMAEIREALRKIDDHLPETFEAFSRLDIEKDGIYKNTEVAIQSTYDICALLVKEHDLGVPSEERKLPDILADHDIIPDNLADTLKDMKGFRNHLAHRYGHIDDQEAFTNIKDGLDDFNRFLHYVEQQIEE